jgi:hypothetical protein
VPQLTVRVIVPLITHHVPPCSPYADDGWFAPANVEAVGVRISIYSRDGPGVGMADMAIGDSVRVGAIDGIGIPTGVPTDELRVPS